MAKKKKTKRTITPEHLKAMQEGKAKAARHRKIVADAEGLEKRMRDAERESAKPVKIGRKRHRY
jgi:hypothetical protein